MNIVNRDGRWGTFCWSGGVRFWSEPTLLEEARKDFDAVINRLLREGKVELAEKIFECLTKTTY